MSDPISFDSASPRFALPLLFAGQAQKEAFVNEAMSLLDGLLHCAVEAVTPEPPAAPADGLAWLIAADASGDWAGRSGQLALRQAGEWLYVVPSDGTRALNKASGQDWRFVAGAWTAAVPPSEAAGGTVVDTEARVMLGELVAALRQAGVFAA